MVPSIQELFVQRLSSAWPFRLAAFALVALALALGACGRKGPLDPPPGASTPAPDPADALRLGHAPDPAGFGSRNG
jgi:predicted small lipoprotein YifL